MDIKDIYWLAGLLEGEGYFCFRIKNDSTMEISIRLRMTDHDVIKKAARIMGSYTGRSGRPTAHYNLGRKDQYSVNIYSDRAVGWMMTLYSLMGARRQTQIKQALNGWKSYTRLRQRHAS